ncbi:signal recognition particle-docking protein FtsY [Methyloraptor flagellatus]|uniref:Signal recognition particle receptor FtsY n=1 Tax=Methyloraptor flagellatus TaxID=3162530 RepID=A0AAU7X8U8_9HYPH
MTEKRGFWKSLFGGKDQPAEAPIPAEPHDRAMPDAEPPVSETEAEALFEHPESTAKDVIEVAPEPAPATAPAVAPPVTVSPVTFSGITAPPVPVPAEPDKKSWWQKLKSGLARTSSSLTTGITAIFTKRKLDGATLDELEDILIQADLGLPTAMKITEALRRDRFDKEISDEEVRAVLAHEVEKVLLPVAKPLAIDTSLKPHVILVVGVNGTGKTTTIGKLAQMLGREGRKVTLCAGDTFRAAAIDQLRIWGSRTGASVIAREPGADAAGLAFDALKAAKADGSDVLVIDTAGRLQNKAELMAELEKIVRVIKKQDLSAPHDVLLTLDATTGQNALNQVEIFGKVAGVTGLVMTKLDGTARGGILVAIAEKFRLPVHFIGVGEGADDLEPFEASDFAKAIAGLDG